MKIEPLKPPLDPSTNIKGLDYIDVPGLSSKDYKLAFHAHKESQPQIKVVYRMPVVYTKCLPTILKLT